MGADGPVTDSGPRVGHILAGDVWAGAEAQVWQLVRLLPAQGFIPHVAVLNPGDVLDRFTALGVSTTLVDARRSDRRKTAERLYGWIAGSGLALVHVHKAREQILVALGGVARLRAPLVRTLHGVPELPRGRNRWKGLVALGLDYVALRYRTAAVIAVSEDLATRYRPFLGRTPVRVIHNGVSISSPPCGARTDHAPRLAYCGRLAPVKELDRLVVAMATVRQALPNAELWIVGTGGEENRLRQLTRDLGLADAVHFLGFHPDVAAVLRDVDVVVLSSRHEGLPMIVLEAAAAGKPVVAPRVGGIPEVVRHGETGLLVAEITPRSIADACIGLLRDPTRARALGTAARQRIAADFTAEATASATAALYTMELRGTGAVPRQAMA